MKQETDLLQVFLFQLSFVGGLELNVWQAPGAADGRFLLDRSHGQQNQTLSVSGNL